MALNAFGMVVGEVVRDVAPPKPRPAMTQKQVQSAMRRQRQAQGKAQTASRDRAASTSRKVQAERNVQTRSERNTVKQENRISRGKKDSPHESMKKRVNKQVREMEKIERPEGQENETAKVKWLNKLPAEEREAREEELIQSLKAAGHYVFKDTDGNNRWIQKVEDNAWSGPDYSRATGDQYSTKYDGLLNRRHEGSVDDIDLDVFM